MSVDQHVPEQDGQDPILDQAISEIRNEPVAPAEVNAAAGRVWARLRQEAAAGPAPVETIRTCADFQALIPAWREGRLAPARALLLQDHIHECPACRKAHAAAKQTSPVVELPARRRASPVWRWAMAAAVVAGLGFSAWFAWRQFAPAPAGVRATVQAVNGVLYKAAEGASASLPAGAPIREREAFRTAKGSGALVKLRDGSEVEMRERTELTVSEDRRGITIQLQGGSIIVQAARQRSGRLYVSTEDCLVAVTGTIFAVNHGIKGSLVSVIEGEVRVAQGNETKVLRPGEQLSTSAALTPVSVQEEIAWSTNFDQYAALLKEFAALRKKLETMPGPGLRYSSRLLELAPDGTAFYGSIPNLGPTLTEANRIFRDQLQQSEVLRQWWAENMKDQAKFDEALTRIRSFSDYLGPEIVLALGPNAAGRFDSPLVMAEVVRSGFRERVLEEIKKIGAEARGESHIRLIDDPAAIPAGGKGMLVYIAGNVAAASDNPAQLQKFAALVARPGTGGFSKTPFYTRISQAYRDGVSWLFCADLQPLVGPAKQDESYLRSGFGDARYLVVQRKEVQGQAENRAALTFSQPRRGIASWLAAPAPMRVLNFISADATFAAAFLVKNPSQLVEDLFSMMETSGPSFLRNLAEFEAKSGVSVRNDLARPLGGEVAVAIDGPVLPQPSWKLVLEVYDPPRFQQTIENLVAAASREMQKSNVPPLQVQKEQAGGVTYYALRGPMPGIEAHYVYESGFLIAAPSRELLVRALQYRATGYTLPRSAKFAALLPRDGHTNFSGMIYHSVGSLLAPLAGKLTPEQQRALEAAAPNDTPSLILAYGEQDRIELASKGTFFGLGPEKLLGIGVPGLSGPSRPRHGRQRPGTSL